MLSTIFPPLFESCRPEKSQTRCPLLQPHDSPCATQPPSSTSPHWTNSQLFLGPGKPLSFVGYQRRISGALVATHQRSAGRGTGKHERQWEGTDSELLRRDPNNRAAPRSPFWRVEFGKKGVGSGWGTPSRGHQAPRSLPPNSREFLRATSGGGKGVAAGRWAGRGSKGSAAGPAGVGARRGRMDPAEGSGREGAQREREKGRDEGRASARAALGLAALTRLRGARAPSPPPPHTKAPARRARPDEEAAPPAAARLSIRRAARRAGPGRPHRPARSAPRRPGGGSAPRRSAAAPPAARAEAAPPHGGAGSEAGWLKPLRHPGTPGPTSDPREPLGPAATGPSRAFARTFPALTATTTQAWLFLKH